MLHKYLFFIIIPYTSSTTIIRLQMKFKKLLLGATIALASLGANAELITTDWLSEGDNQAVLDTNSGITYLQLNNTTETMQNILNKMVSGGTLQGWSFANRYQIDSLWENGTHYVFANMNKVNADRYVAAGWYREDTDDLGFIGTLRDSKWYDREGYAAPTYYGWWIVKGEGSVLSETSTQYELPENYIPVSNTSSVPISASFGLLALGLAGLSLRRKK